MEANQKVFRFRDEKFFFWVSFLPTALVIFSIILFPILFTLVLGFFNKNTLVGPYTFAGLENFRNLLADPQFWLAFKNGIIYSLGSTVFSVVGGLLVALLLNEEFRGRSILRATVIFPYIVPPIVALFIWKFLFNSRGLINQLLVQLGVIEQFIPWLGDIRFVMPTVILISAWVWFPFSAINLLAGLQAIPKDIYEAASIDGASAAQRFFQITIPMLMPVILVVVIIRFIWAARNFDMIYLLTGGGPLDATYVLPILAYKSAFSVFRLGYASAVATALFVFLVVMALIYFQVYGMATRITRSR